MYLAEVSLYLFCYILDFNFMVDFNIFLIYKFDFFIYSMYIFIVWLCQLFLVRCVRQLSPCNRVQLFFGTNLGSFLCGQSTVLWSIL